MPEAGYAIVMVAVYVLRQPFKCSRRVSGYFTLIGDAAPLVARGSSEVARCHPHTGNGELNLCLSSRIVQPCRTMGAAREHNPWDVIYLIPDL